jgi:choline dehydrogenase-like flavoprotein
LSNRRDKHGIPLLNINWRITEKDKERLWRAIDIFGLEVAKLGLGRVRSLKDRASRLFDDQIGFGHHHMGTTRMSESPKNGVVDSEQRVFGVTNLSMAGSSVFSTGGHVPPTLTIVATSIRLSEIVAKRLSKGLNNEA